MTSRQFCVGSISNRRRSELPLYSGHYPLAPVSPTGIICMHPANKKRHYSVTPYLIGWTHIQNTCSRFIRFRYNTTTYNSTLHSTLQWLSWKVEHSSFLHRTMDYGNPDGHPISHPHGLGWGWLPMPHCTKYGSCYGICNNRVNKRPVSSQMFSIKYDPMASWLNYVLNAKLMGIFT